MTDSTHAAAAPARARHLGLAIFALAMGGFAIGTTEFMTMGLLPEMAESVNVSIPSAGHLISAYAVGVVVGAPLLAYFGARFPRRALLVWLMVAYGLLNLASAFVGNYELLTLARFLDGLPHGAYFGVASLVAASLAKPEHKGRAVAAIMLGLSIANVLGVPAATWLGQQAGWQAAFVATALISLVTVALILAFVPSLPGDPHAVGKRELAFFTKPQVWFTLAAGALGFGGMFAVYTYIAETIDVVGGLSDGVRPLFLLVFGLGMVAGTWLGGELAGYSVFRTLVGAGVASAIVMLLFWLLAPHGWWSLPIVFSITTVGSVMVVNLQLRLMSVSGEAETLGAAMNHASLNVANAMGAWLGGLVISAGLGYRAPALVGAVLSVIGVLILLAARTAQRRETAGALAP